MDAELDFIFVTSRNFCRLACAETCASTHEPDEIYEIIESCSPDPYLELFARFRRKDWAQWATKMSSRIHGTT